MIPMASFLSQLIQLNQQYKLIKPDQPVILAISGGIDSLSMAMTMAEYRHAVDPDLPLWAVYVRIPQVALTDKDISQMSDFFAHLKIPLKVLPGAVSADQEFRCYTCAKERRKQLCLYAADNGYSTIAFGHNLDDYLETGFMNLIYGGHLESLHPRQPLFDDQITVIRPLLGISKKHIAAYAKSRGLPRIHPKCRFESAGKRAAVRQKMIELQHFNKAFTPNLQHAVNRWNQLDI
jgi:tRNA 2-thiocytidine biosynthesis protein TtcA